MPARRWYHTLFIVIVVVISVVIGILDLWFGAATPDGVDDIVVRVTGVVLLVAAFGMIMRKAWGYFLGAAGFLLSVAEILFTHDFTFTPTDTFLVGCVCAVLAVAGVLCIWLRKVGTMAQAS